MGGILGGLSDLLFGKVEIPEADFDELAKLLQLGIDENRYDQRGMFVDNTWDKDKGTLTTGPTEAIAPGFAAMLERANTGTPGYEGAGRFKELLAAQNFGSQPDRRPRPQPRERILPTYRRPEGG